MRKQGRKDQVEAAPPPHVPFQDGRGSGVGSKPSVAPSAGMLPGLKHRVCQGRTDGLRHLGLSHEGFGFLDHCIQAPRQGNGETPPSGEDRFLLAWSYEV